MRPKVCVLSITQWTQGLTIHLFGNYSHNSASNRAASPGPQLEVQLRQQPLEPGIVPASLIPTRTACPRNDP